MRRIIITAGIILILSNLMSYSILDMQAGNQILNIDARSSAMGSAAAAGGNRFFDYLLNPANLSFLDQDFGAQVTIGVIRNSENRSLPMYNSFDAYVDKATYVSNANFFSDLAIGAFGRKSFTDFELTGSLIYRPYVDFNANYQEQVRNNENSDFNSYPPIIAKNYLESKGDIEAISLITSFKYQDFIAVGLEIDKLFGDSKSKRKIKWSQQARDLVYPDTLFDFHSELSREFDATTFKVGLRAKLLPRLGVGFSFAPKVEFDVTGNKDDIDLDDAVYLYITELTETDTLIIIDSLMYSEYILPMRFRAGFSYEPRNIMRTYFNIDMEYVKWSDVLSLYDDVVNYYVGIEHKLQDKIPLRIGFSYRTTYGIHEDNEIVFAEKVSIPTFTAGSGFKILERFTVDLGIEYSHRSYENLDLFQDSYYDYEDLWDYYYYMNLQDRGWENPDTVDETCIDLKISVNYQW